MWPFPLEPKYAKGQVSAATGIVPNGYKGLYAFHKYWGKKPHEIFGFLIENLSDSGDIVLDPFVGSGVCGREAVIRNRKFIGVDINPIAVQLSRLMVSPPKFDELQSAMKEIIAKCRQRIFDSYSLKDGSIGTHYLWEGDRLLEVWTKGTARRRLERMPTDFDLERITIHNESLASRRMPQFFSNSRINSYPGMGWDELFTRRAQSNINLLLDVILASPQHIRPALELCMTAAIGQMSKMVFVVKNRGKARGQKSSKIEVGSWAIGYWRPSIYFEVNVWNCFSRRVDKLLKSLQSLGEEISVPVSEQLGDVICGTEVCALRNGDARTELETLPAESADLVITDPPHGDRVPYLELSELWNSLLGRNVDFESEVVISNAKERGKSEARYADSMQSVFTQMTRVLKPNGLLIVLFNSTNANDWEVFRRAAVIDNGMLQWLGSFPCNYSTGSIVQDNRPGALKNDMGLVFGKLYTSGKRQERSRALSNLPGWDGRDLSAIAGG